MSQPSTIILSTDKFLRKFSVSETSSCICLLWRENIEPGARLLITDKTTCWGLPIAVAHFASFSSPRDHGACELIVHGALWCIAESDALGRLGTFPGFALGTEVLLAIKFDIENFSQSKFKLFSTLESLQHRRKVRVVFTFCQHLETVMMVPYVLLIDAQHRQKHVKQITCKLWHVLVSNKSTTAIRNTFNETMNDLRSRSNLFLWCEIIHKLSQHNKHYFGS